MRKLAVPMAVAITVLTLISVAVAGNPHFVDDTVQFSRAGNTLTVTGKEAGLGDEAQVHIVLSATAECINGGGHHPRAANKESVSSAGDFPVQNGKADFNLSVTATFFPNCSPPMTVEFTDVTVSDTTNGISKSFNGNF